MWQCQICKQWFFYNTLHSCQLTNQVYPMVYPLEQLQPTLERIAKALEKMLEIYKEYIKS